MIFFVFRCATTRMELISILSIEPIPDDRFVVLGRKLTRALFGGLL